LICDARLATFPIKDSIARNLLKIKFSA